MWRFAATLDRSDRLIATVARWAWRLEGGGIYSRLTLQKLVVLRTTYPQIADMYDQVFRDLRTGLRYADRLHARPVLGVWE